MAPPSTSTATARKVSTSHTAHESGRRSSRPPLRVVPARRPGKRGNRWLSMAAATLVVLSLLVVVVGQAMLANGQVRLSAVEQKLATEQGVHRQAESQVAGMETPSKIISKSLSTLHLVRPTGVVQLPYVSLTTPLATPNVTPATATPSTPPATGQ
jgi:hypothetical protein